jgi:hypothetical protein
MSFAKCKLERPTTLGKGDTCCDFYITRLWLGSIIKLSQRIWSLIEISLYIV